MDFRKAHCVWCILRDESHAVCKACPKYKKHVLHREGLLEAEAFCSVCNNQGNEELKIFCVRNRFFQTDSGEDFDCYKFCLKSWSKG